MRGIPSLITDIRKNVFTEVARMAYNGGDYTQAEDLPFKIVPGDQPLHRESIFLERAIAGERVRLAMGLSIRPIQTRSLMTEGMDAAAIAEQYYEPPLINIIPYACHACPTNQYRVTENCQNCLAASCQKVCPKGAVSFVNGKSHIDPEKCIKCGKCAGTCRLPLQPGLPEAAFPRRRRSRRDRPCPPADSPCTCPPWPSASACGIPAAPPPGRS